MANQGKGKSEGKGKGKSSEAKGSKQGKLAARFAERFWIGSKAPKQGKSKSGLNLEFFCAALLAENSEAKRPRSDAALAEAMRAEFPDFERSNSEAGPKFIRGLRSNLNRGGLRAQRAGNMSKPANRILEFDSKGKAIGEGKSKPEAKGKSKPEAKGKSKSKGKGKRRSIGSKGKPESKPEAKGEPESEAASA